MGRPSHITAAAALRNDCTTSQNRAPRPQHFARHQGLRVWEVLTPHTPKTLSAICSVLVVRSELLDAQSWHSCWLPVCLRVRPL